MTFWNMARIEKTIVFRSLKLLNKKDRRKLATVALVQILMSFFDLFGIVIIGALGALSLQGIESKGPGNRVSILLDLLHLKNLSFNFQIALLGMTAAIVLVIKTLASIFFTRKIFYFLSGKSAEISTSLIAKILSQSLIEINRFSKQEVIFNVDEGVKNIMLGVVANFVTIASEVFTLLILSIGLFVIDPLIALLTIVIFISIGFTLHHFLQVRAKELGSEINHFTIENNEKIFEVLSSYRESIVHNRREYYSSQIGILRKKLANSNAEANFQPFISKYVMEGTTVIGTLLISATEFGTKNAVHAVGTLAIFIASSSRIAPSALRIQQGFLMIRNSQGSSKNTFEMIKNLKNVNEVLTISRNAIFLYDDFKPSLEMKGVNFKYPENSNFRIAELNLKINPGESLAIVGPSGGGKSTLIDLILGVLHPDGGYIKISGEEPSVVSKIWSGAISYVPQNVFIANGTIRENVSLGYPIELATDERVREVLDIAQLSPFVMDLPDGIDSEVGENGSKLSGGQKQRLGIARALFTSPKFLVLDEATSALDGQTELDISKALESLHGDVSLIVVAHRLSTVRNVDKVAYIENGKILAEGNFTQVRNQIPNFDKQAQLMGIEK